MAVKRRNNGYFHCSNRSRRAGDSADWGYRNAPQEEKRRGGLEVHFHHFVEGRLGNLNSIDFESIQDLGPLAAAAEPSFYFARLRDTHAFELEDIAYLDPAVLNPTHFGDADDLARSIPQTADLHYDPNGIRQLLKDHA